MVMLCVVLVIYCLGDQFVAQLPPGKRNRGLWARGNFRAVARANRCPRRPQPKSSSRFLEVPLGWTKFLGWCGLPRRAMRRFRIQIHASERQTFNVAWVCTCLESSWGSSHFNHSESTKMTSSRGDFQWTTINVARRIWAQDSAKVQRTLGCVTSQSQWGRSSKAPEFWAGSYQTTVSRGEVYFHASSMASRHSEGNMWLLALGWIFGCMTLAQLNQEKIDRNNSNLVVALLQPWRRHSLSMLTSSSWWVQSWVVLALTHRCASLRQRHSINAVRSSISIRNLSAIMLRNSLLRKKFSHIYLPIFHDRL